MCEIGRAMFFPTKHGKTLPQCFLAPMPEGRCVSAMATVFSVIHVWLFYACLFSLSPNPNHMRGLINKFCCVHIFPLSTLKPCIIQVDPNGLIIQCDTSVFQEKVKAELPTLLGLSSVWRQKGLRWPSVSLAYHTPWLDFCTVIYNIWHICNILYVIDNDILYII